MVSFAAGWPPQTHRGWRIPYFSHFQWQKSIHRPVKINTQIVVLKLHSIWLFCCLFVDFSIISFPSQGGKTDLENWLSLERLLVLGRPPNWPHTYHRPIKTLVDCITKSHSQCRHLARGSRFEKWKGKPNQPDDDRSIADLNWTGDSYLVHRSRKMKFRTHEERKLISSASASHMCSRTEQQVEIIGHWKSVLLQTRRSWWPFFCFASIFL